MPIKARDKAAELLEVLRNRPNSDLPDVVQFLRYRLETAKDRLVTCGEADLPGVRGEAATLKKLIDDFTRAPLTGKTNG